MSFYQKLYKSSRRKYGGTPYSPPIKNKIKFVFLIESELEKRRKKFISHNVSVTTVALTQFILSNFI
ncbi:MAG: hypothetical protein UX39_C0001G0085 [Candidatus Magasanikbacteria bacterium GW2011_GWA2_46_17]|uniref:Uncharacterized protein n=1 Tax=Candidatus Magasanikbacteria bacterium GW2011_GWA2_46_17 TaxID=1619042 RepID=A0A0G1S2C8_9BACT|nr:MAG: hypothetical protein UX39_C0001G0085 [Candidatus Magasanikbacteria bacterium GW2011_GWA2_46_17]